jgi:hypothetical protein
MNNKDQGSLELVFFVVNKRENTRFTVNDTTVVETPDTKPVALYWRANSVKPSWNSRREIRMGLL